MTRPPDVFPYWSPHQGRGDLRRCLRVCNVERQARLQVAILSPVDFLLCWSHPGWLCPARCHQCFQGLQAPAPGWRSCRAWRRWTVCWDLSDSSSLLSSSWLYHQKCFLRRRLQPRKLHAQNSSVQPRNPPARNLFYCTFQPVPSLAPGSLIERGKLKTT